MYKQCVIGLEGTGLTTQEIEWLKHQTPKGVILFARNVQSPEQVKSLLSDVSHYAGKEIWVAIDEEGGRVHRMPWAPFHKRKQAADFGLLYKKDPDLAIKEVYSDAYRAGKALKELGFTHNCAPVLDVLHEQGDPIIGNRAYDKSPETITVLGTACLFGLQDSGIKAIGKHFPGHGRANADSHIAMPEVGADFETILAEASPFSDLFTKGLEHVMSAHVTYTAVNPDIATFSSFWLKNILRETLKFAGEIWSDDLCMKGCGLPVPEAVKTASQAGCTVLLVCEPDGVKALMEAN